MKMGVSEGTYDISFYIGSILNSPLVGITFLGDFLLVLEDFFIAALGTAFWIFLGMTAWFALGTVSGTSSIFTELSSISSFSILIDA